MAQFDEFTFKRRLQTDENQARFAEQRRKHKFQVKLIKHDQQHRQKHGLAARTVPLGLYAIGDSWFDYPLDDGDWNFGIVYDIVPHLRQLGNPNPLVLAQAHYGQPMTIVMGAKNRMQYVTDITDPDNWPNNKPDAIIISGGGNDIVGDQFVLYLAADGTGLNPSTFTECLDLIEQAYKELFAFRDKYAPNIPIIGHCYDYAIPNDRGVKVWLEQFGPWLWPSLNLDLYSYAQGLVIVAQAIDAFYQRLSNLANAATNNFMLVDTRGTLTRDDVYPGGWANELHPFTSGFGALAQKWLGALTRIFPGRI